MPDTRLEIKMNVNVGFFLCKGNLEVFSISADKNEMFEIFQQLYAESEGWA